METLSKSQGPQSLASSDELLCTPFLDTDTLKATEHADAVLQSRGYPRWLIRLLRRIFAVGLWTQIFVWEECSLSIGDVFCGYGALLLLVGLFASFGSFFKAALWFGVAGAFFIALGTWFWRRRRLQYDQYVRELHQNDKP
jgi:hypothetical protein